MKYYNDTISYGETFEERIGAPEKFDAALGRIVTSFSYLEETLSNIIILLLHIENDLGDILTAELSYKNKINIFSSLLQYNMEKYMSFNRDIDERYKELISLCNKAEQLRNQIIHSSYVSNRYRIKKTARAKKGLIKTIEKVNPDYLFDIADFIVMVGMSVEELPMFMGIAESISASSDEVTYINKGKIIKKFKHEIKPIPTHSS